jgi:hypothetical protein
MTKIYSEPTVIEYKINITNKCDEDQLNEYINRLPQHPCVLNPVRVVRENREMWLAYKVTTKGTTLQKYILSKPAHRHTGRLSARISGLFHHKKRLNPIQIMMQLIDGYEFLLNNHMLTGQSNINPESIWVEQDDSGNMIAFVINTVEAMTMGEYDSSNTSYWAPEMLSKYNHAAFYDTTPSIQSLTSKLKRYDTRPSTISAVYSLGLILYFIVARHEPFEGTRVNVYDKPPMQLIHDELIQKYILIALVSDMRERPTLQEFREFIDPTKNTAMCSGCIIFTTTTL